MTRRTRVLFAAFVLVVGSLGGAFYLARANVGATPALLLDAGTGTSGLDLRAMLDPSRNVDERMLDSSLRRVEHEYYKPIDPRTLLTGERNELATFLRAHHISPASLPHERASNDESAEVDALNADLAAAQKIYDKPEQNSELTQVAVRGMLDALGDPYTTYLSRAQINSLEESLKGGDFGGIGVYIVQDPRNGHVLVEPIEGTPAYRAGVKIGDRIIAVDGHAVDTMKLDAVERLIRGKIGTTVHVLVRSHGAATSHDVAIVRDQIYVPSVHAKIEDGFDYVRLADFGQTSYDEVRRAMLDGKAHNVKGFILDLRNNGGGLLEAAVEISSLFIPQGPIVSTIDRAGHRETKTATQESIGAMPLVILVNKYTASASEITAGAVQDYHVGTLIGTKTFGKGVVQSIFNTIDGGALKITTAKYVTPLGRDIHHKGIPPDVVVNQIAELPIIDTPKDLQLAAAKAYLRRVARR